MRTTVDSIILNDIPKLTKGVEAQTLENKHAAAPIIMWGAGVAVATAGPGGDTVVAAVRYGLGGLALFGAQKMLTECCDPLDGLNNPDFDRLILNMAVWLASIRVRTSSRHK